MIPQRIGVVADDLTGSTDVALPFWRAGLSAVYTVYQGGRFRLAHFYSITNGPNNLEKYLKNAHDDRYGPAPLSQVPGAAIQHHASAWLADKSARTL